MIMISLHSLEQLAHQRTLNFILRIKNKKAVKEMLCMEFVAAKTLLAKLHILVRHLNHYSIVLGNTVDLVAMEMIQQSSNT